MSKGKCFFWSGHNHRAHPQASKLLALYGAGFRQLVRTDAQLGLTGYARSRVGHGTSVTVRLPLYREDCRVPKAAAYLQPA